MSSEWVCPDCGVGNLRTSWTCACGHEREASSGPPPSIELASSAEMYLWLSRAAVVLRIMAYLSLAGTVLYLFGQINVFIQLAPSEAKEASFVGLLFSLVATMLGGAASYILLRGAEQACTLLLGVHRRVGSIDERTRSRA